jgi:predicted transcriptional regulator
VKAETPLDLITIRRNDFERVTQTITSVRAVYQKSDAALTRYEALLTMARERPRLASLTVGDLMSTPAETLPADISLREAVRRFSGGSPGYPIVDANGRLEGYCGRTEIFSALKGGLSLDTRIRAFMRRDLPVVLENQRFLEAAVTLLREDVELLPVASMDGSERVVGVISPFDVILKAIEPLTETRDDGKRLAS